MPGPKIIPSTGARGDLLRVNLPADLNGDSLVVLPRGYKVPGAVDEDRVNAIALIDLARHIVAEYDAAYDADARSVFGDPDAETADNDERGDICAALRGAGFEDSADDAGGVTVEDARDLYEQRMGAPWRSELAYVSDDEDARLLRKHDGA